MNHFYSGGGVAAMQSRPPVMPPVAADEIHTDFTDQGTAMNSGTSGMSMTSHAPLAWAPPQDSNPNHSMNQPNQGEPFSLPQPSTLQWDFNLSQDAIDSPVSMQEAYAGSMKAMLGRNVGHYVVASFLVGTQMPVSWEGFLHSVGNDYLVIFQPGQDRYITCDLYSLKFLEIHDQKGVVPPCAGYRHRDALSSW